MKTNKDNLFYMIDLVLTASVYNTLVATHDLVHASSIYCGHVVMDVNSAEGNTLLCRPGRSWTYQCILGTPAAALCFTALARTMRPAPSSPLTPQARP